MQNASDKPLDKRGLLGKDETHHGDEHSVTNYILYKRRWMMLFIFSLLSLTNAMLWITFAPIATRVEEYFNVSSLAVNFLSMAYMIVYIPFVWVASWILDMMGLRAGLICGGVLNFAGATIRFLAVCDYSVHWFSFPIIVLGQTLAALAQTFILGAPPKVAANWFGVKERTTATSIGALFNQLGIAVGFIIDPLVVQSNDDIPTLLFVEAIITLAVLVAVVSLIRDAPPTPPSASATSEKELFIPAIKLLLVDVHFILIFIAFGVVVGGFYAVSTLLDIILSPFGYEDSTGILGFLLVITGVIGALVVGIVADKFNNPNVKRILLIITFFGTLASLIGFALAVRPNNFVILIIICCTMGLFMTAVLPISLEMVVDHVHPVPEGIASGAVLMSAQVFGILFILFMNWLGNLHTFTLSNWLLVGCVGAVCFLVLFFKPKNKRQLVEH